MLDLGITDSTIGALQVSIFLFGYAIGPLFLAPLSETYGRTIVTHIGNFIFVAFSIGAGFAQTVSILSCFAGFMSELISIRQLSSPFVDFCQALEDRQLLLCLVDLLLTYGT
jgi:MFS family permease